MKCRAFIRFITLRLLFVEIKKTGESFILLYREATIRPSQSDLLCFARIFYADAKTCSAPIAQQCSPDVAYTFAAGNKKVCVNTQ